MPIKEEQGQEQIEGETTTAETTADDSGGEAEFLGGFASVRGEEPSTPVKTDEPLDEPALVTPPEVPALPVDPNAELRAQLKAELVAELTPQLRALDGRIGGINRDLKQALTAARDTAAASAADAPNDRQIAAAVAVPEKWTKLKDEFPEWAEAFEEFTAAHMAAAKPSNAPAVDAEQIRSQVMREITPEIERSTKQARSYAHIDLAIGDGWESTVKSDAFGSWFNQLPAEKRTQYDTDRPADVIKCLKEYGTYQSAAQTRQRKSDRLASAVQVESIGAGGPPVLTDEDAFLAGANSVLEKRQRPQR